MMHSHRSMVDSDRGVSNNLDRGRSIVASDSLIGDLLGDSITIVSILHSLDPAPVKVVAHAPVAVHHAPVAVHHAPIISH